MVGCGGFFANPIKNYSMDGGKFQSDEEEQKLRKTVSENASENVSKAGFGLQKK